MPYTSKGKLSRALEDRYVKCCIRLRIKDKDPLVIFFLPHGHHLLDPAFGEDRWMSDIRAHLYVSGYGEQGFNDSLWREQLCNKGYENACIVEHEI